MRIGTTNLEWNRRNPFTKPTSRTYRISVVKEETMSFSVQMDKEVRRITPIGLNWMMEYQHPRYIKLH